MAGGINPSPAQRWDFLIGGARCLRRGRIGAEAEAVGAAQRRARPAAAAGRRRPGARPARGRGQQSQGSGLPGAEHVQQRQRVGAGDRRPQVSTRKKATGPDRAAGRRRPGARPARRRGQQSQVWGCPAPSTSSSGSGPASARCSPSSPTWPAVAGVGAARRRARPAAAAGRHWPGARPARRRGRVWLAGRDWTTQAPAHLAGLSCGRAFLHAQIPAKTEDKHQGERAARTLKSRERSPEPAADRAGCRCSRHAKRTPGGGSFSSP